MIEFVVAASVLFRASLEKFSDMLMRAAKDLRLALGAGATSAIYGEDCASTDKLILTEPISRSLKQMQIQMNDFIVKRKINYINNIWLTGSAAEREGGIRLFETR